LNRRLVGSPRFAAICTGAVLWVAAGALAVNMATASGPDAVGASGPAAARLLIASSAILSQQALNQAEREYHGGRPNYAEEAFTNSVFQALAGRLQPRDHIHLEGSAAKEILPWFRFAMWAEPCNVTNALLASYWLARAQGGAQSALDVLNEAMRDNPRDYLVYMGKGRLYAKADERNMARRYYERALALWPGGSDGRDDDVRMDKREILSRLAVLDELDGNIPSAIERMRGIVEVLPGKSLLFQNRMGILGRGEVPRQSALERWNALRGEEYLHLCSAGHEEHEAHDHGGHQP